MADGLARLTPELQGFSALVAAFSAVQLQVQGVRAFRVWDSCSGFWQAGRLEPLMCFEGVRCLFWADGFSVKQT